ncbi:phage integrase N-terminal SAM-like domain-containing protein [Nonomuraea sp. NPDC049758]|uniref:phage integrase N-terminal SAM-like domain-containing protein n=1 Tax=Nonomuraea sp. NPDC049758 TaxID=3154360 RepID=UPI0034452CC2
MSRDGAVPGSASLQLVAGTVLLRPQEQVAEAMLDGWRNQQLARNLAFSTIEGRLNAVRAFSRHADAHPWEWTSKMVDDWLGDLRAVRHLKQSTLRNYAEAIRSFCAFITDAAYGWAAECERRFGTHPIQVCHEWNTATHLQECEADPAKRALTREELQAFSDHADEQVERISGAGRKGWLPAFRTPPCSRPPTPTACAGARHGCSTWSTSTPTLTLACSATSGSVTSASARP